MSPDHMAEIHAACFSQPRPWSIAEFAELLASDRTRIVTTKNGFAVMQKAGPEAELLTIAVHPDARRQGQGASLLSAAITAAKTAFCEEIFLEVMDTNVAAVALYHAAGFRDRAIRKDYYNGPNGMKASALVMHKPL